MKKGQHPSPVALENTRRSACSRRSSGSRCPLKAGMVFGKLTLLSRQTNAEWGASRWLCHCECGKDVIRRGGDLLSQHYKSCGCNRTDAQRLRPFEALYKQYVYKCTRRNVPLALLTYEEFLTFTKENECHYCGAPISWSEYNTIRNGQKYNIDRKDNNLGYTLDNCVACCKRCNVGKNRFFSYEEWLTIGSVIRAMRKVAA